MTEDEEYAEFRRLVDEIHKKSLIERYGKVAEDAMLMEWAQAAQEGGCLDSMEYLLAHRSHSLMCRGIRLKTPWWKFWA